MEKEALLQKRLKRLEKLSKEKQEFLEGFYEKFPDLDDQKELIEFLGKFLFLETDLEKQKENPGTSRELTQELHKALVEKCIEILDENTEVSEVSFSIDNLQDSIKYKQWVPSTDSSLTMWDENGALIQVSL